jgi:hypothetical protein
VIIQMRRNLQFRGSDLRCLREEGSFPDRRDVVYSAGTWGGVRQNKTIH